MRKHERENRIFTLMHEKSVFKDSKPLLKESLRETSKKPFLTSIDVFKSAKSSYHYWISTEDV